MSDTEKKKQDVYYLKSILAILHRVEAEITHGPTLWSEVVGDDIDWLEDYIENKEKEI